MFTGLQTCLQVETEEGLKKIYNRLIELQVRAFCAMELGFWFSPRFFSFTSVFI